MNGYEKNIMRKLVSYILFAFMLMSCSSDPSLVKAIPLSLSATCAGIATKNLPDILPSGLLTGVYVTTQNVALSNTSFSNREYVSGDTGGLSGEQDVELTIGNSYDIYAYAPYQNTVSDLTAIVFTHGTDVLWAPEYTLTNVSMTNRTAALVFEHRVAQISFNVGFANDFSSGSKVITPSSTIHVTGFYSRGALNVSTGSLTPFGNADTSLNGIGTGTTGSMTLYIGGTCFIPAQGAMTLNVRIVHEGQEYHGTITDTFSSGSSYNYTVTLSGYSPTLGIGGKLTDWTPVFDSISVR